MIVEHKCAVTWKIFHIVAETFFSKNSSSALLMFSKYEFDIDKTSERKKTEKNISVDRKRILENLYFPFNKLIHCYLLGDYEIICSMLESKRICVSLLHLFNFIDIDSFTLEPLPTSFLNLEFFIVLRSSVKK